MNLLKYQALFIITSFVLSACTNMKEDIDYTRFNTIPSYLDYLESSEYYPGIAFATVNSDGEKYSYYSGKASIGEGTEVNGATSFYAFSMTKIFTSLAILQLCDRNQLSLEDPAALYLPDLPYAVTIRQILSHTSGIPDPLWGSYFIHFPEEHARLDRKAFLKEVVSKHNKLEFEPGTDVKYTNLGYAILGRIIEKVSGKSYEQYIKENIFNPLGISDDEAGFNPLSIENLAQPYIHKSLISRLMIKIFMKKNTFTREENWVATRKEYYFDFPAHGGLIISPDQMGKFLAAIVRQDPVLLKTETWDKWFTQEGSSGFSLGWRITGT